MTSSISLDPTIMQRLTLIRLLHQQGVEQSRLPELLAFTSILSFHDAVEHFLVLTGEHLGATLPKSIQFMQYWSELSKGAQPKKVELSGKMAMQRLNGLRVSLKHSGAMPGPQAIQQVRADVASFFEENTPKVFDIEFAKIDMADLIAHAEARQTVKEADLEWSRGERIRAMGLLVQAFNHLFHEHVRANRSLGTRFSFGPTLAASRSDIQNAFGRFHLPASGVARDTQRSGQQGLGRQLGAVAEASREMQQALRVMAIGVEYHRYQQFLELTPTVWPYSSTDIRVQHHPLYAPTEEEFEYCERFVIEMALRLAEINAVVVKPSWLPDEFWRGF